MRCYLLLIIAILLISGCTQVNVEDDNMKIKGGLEEPEQTETDAGETSVQLSAKQVPYVNRFATFETSMGNFKVELYDDKAPLTAGNFVQLAESGFYDGTKFHRVIDKFMIQGGDPLSKNDSKKDFWGTGGSNPIPDEFTGDLKHDSPGILSMANSGPDTGSSQFFITVTPTPHLDGKHAIFGKVVSGYEIVERVSKVQTDDSDRPKTPVVVKKVKISDS